jgi:anaerobic selenocysteine-containing dehydrogenase
LPRTINMTTIGDDLLRPSSPEFGPKVEAVIVYNANPLAIAPDSAKVMAGFAREDLFTVVLEHFQTDSADYADILLPATTQLEHVDAHTSYGHLYMMANNAAIAPMGEAKPNTEIFRLLAARMGFDDPCFKESDDQLAARHSTRKTCARSASTGKRSSKRAGRKLAMPDAPFAEGGFPTPSGKCEFYSAQMAADGLDPLPAYLPPYESVASESGTGRALSAGDDLSARAQLPQFHFRQREEPAFGGRRTAPGHPSERQRGARHRRRRHGAHLQ